MVLRASAETVGLKLDLRAIVDRTISIGSEDGDLLLDFADAVIGADDGQLRVVQARMVDTLGPDALGSAAAVAANFSRDDRIANSIGIPLEREFVSMGQDLRALLGLDSFGSARNTLG